MKNPTKDELELELKQTEILEKQDRVEIDRNETRIGLIYALSNLLTLHIIDHETSIPGCDPKLIQAFNEEELNIVRDKLFKILKEI